VELVVVGKTRDITSAGLQSIVKGAHKNETNALILVEEKAKKEAAQEAIKKEAAQEAIKKEAAQEANKI
jgi:hypothetical protein